MRVKPRGMVLLLEIVIGLGIFVFVLLFTFGLFTTSNRSTSSTKNMTIASDLAREVMERQLGKGYASVSAEPPTEVAVGAVINGVETTTVFTSRVDVTIESGTTSPNNFQRKHVKVTVSWNEGNDYNRSTELETYVVD